MCVSVFGFDFEFGFGLVFVIFGIFFSFLFLQLVGNLEEGAGQATRILLIAIAHCKPDTNELNACHEEIREYKLRYIHKPQAQQCTYLSEAEEDAETTAQLEGVVDFILQQGATWSAVAQRILRVDTTLFVYQFTAWLVGIGDEDAAGGAGGIEAAAEESILHMFTHLRWHRLPALLGKLLLLLGIDSQAGASNGELNQEQHEQNDHVLFIGGKRYRVKGNQYKPNRSVIKQTNSLSGIAHNIIATWPTDNPPNDAIANSVRKSFASSLRAKSFASTRC